MKRSDRLKIQSALGELHRSLAILSKKVSGRTSFSGGDLMTTTNEVIYAVGDIHGMFVKLEAMISRIQVDAAQKHAGDNKTIVFLGDYVDRGPHSKKVIDRLLQPIPGFNVVCLKGNHEDMMFRAITGERGKADLWAINGGLEVLKEYNGGAIPKMLTPRALQKLIGIEHLQFLRGLPTMYEQGGYLFVHAGIRPGVPLDQQDEDEMLWIREPFLRSKVDHGTIVVHGHTPTDDIGYIPEVRSNRINIDTGACFPGGRLTCAVLSRGKPLRFIDT